MFRDVWVVDEKGGWLVGMYSCRARVGWVRVVYVGMGPTLPSRQSINDARTYLEAAGEEGAVEGVVAEEAPMVPAAEPLRLAVQHRLRGDVMEVFSKGGIECILWW